MPVHADVGVAKDDAVEPRIGNEAAVPDDADSEALGNRLAKLVQCDGLCHPLWSTRIGSVGSPRIRGNRYRLVCTVPGIELKVATRGHPHSRRSRQVWHPKGEPP